MSPAEHIKMHGIEWLKLGLVFGVQIVVVAFALATTNARTITNQSALSQFKTSQNRINQEVSTMNLKTATILASLLEQVKRDHDEIERLRDRTAWKEESKP